MVSFAQQIERQARERAWLYARKTLQARERAFIVASRHFRKDEPSYLDAEAKLAAARAEFEAINRDMEESSSAASMALRGGDDFI
jgi:hypothetical protein